MGDVEKATQEQEADKKDDKIETPAEEMNKLEEEVSFLLSLFPYPSSNSFISRNSIKISYTNPYQRTTPVSNTLKARTKMPYS